MSNRSANLYPGQVPTAEEWNKLFQDKVDAVEGELTNPSVLGLLTLDAAPTQPFHATSKAYVDAVGAGAGIPDAPSDGVQYGRINHGWAPIVLTFNGHLTGNLTVDGNTMLGTSIDSGFRLDVSGSARVSGNLLVGAIADAGYKLDVDSTVASSRFRVTPTTSPLIVSANTGPLPVPNNGTLIHLIGADGGAAARIHFDGFGGTGYVGFRRAEGTSAAPTATTNGAPLGTLQFAGHDGTAYTGNRATFNVVNGSATPWTPISNPTAFTWVVTAVGAITTAEAMRLAPSGDLLIGTATDAGYKLDVNAATTGARFIVGGGLTSLNVQASGAFVPPANAASALLQLIGALNGNPAFTIDAAATSMSGGVPTINGRTWNSVAAVGSANGMTMLNLRGIGWDGSAYTAPRALIQLSTAQVFTATNQGTVIAFSTTPLNSTVTAEVIRIAASGSLLLGTTTDIAGMRLNVNGSANIAGGISLPNATKTGTAYTVLATDTSLILNPSGTFTLTLPAATPAGRMLWIKLIAAFAVNSATANVVPMAGGAATSAILTASAGKYCLLQSDGTAWQLMNAN